MNKGLIDSRLYTLCRTFDNLGLEPVMANYNPSKNDEDFVCEVFFKEGITPLQVYDRLKLPKLMIRTDENCMSTDNSWGIATFPDNPKQCFMYMSREWHVSVIVWILKNYAVKG